MRGSSYVLRRRPRQNNDASGDDAATTTATSGDDDFPTPTCWYYFYPLLRLCHDGTIIPCKLFVQMSIITRLAFLEGFWPARRKSASGARTGVKQHPDCYDGLRRERCATVLSMSWLWRSVFQTFYTAWFSSYA